MLNVCITAEDIAGQDYLNTMPGAAPLYTWATSYDVCRKALDHTGNMRGFQRRKNRIDFIAMH